MRWGAYSNGEDERDVLRRLYKALHENLAHRANRRKWIGRGGADKILLSRGLVVPGIISHMSNTIANWRHSRSLGNVDYLIEQWATAWIEKRQ